MADEAKQVAATEDRYEARHTAAEWLPKTRRVIAPTFVTTTMPPDMADLAAACETLTELVRVDATGLPIDDVVLEAKYAGILLSVRILVCDREAPPHALKWLQVWRNLSVPWEVVAMNGPDYLVRWLRETIANVLAHEVDESITLHGVRVFDPHRPLLASSPGQTGDKAGTGGPQLPAAGALVEREAPTAESGAAGNGQRARETPRAATRTEGGALPPDPTSERATLVCTRCSLTPDQVTIGGPCMYGTEHDWRPAGVLVPAPGDACGGSRLLPNGEPCPGCRACA